MCLNGYGYGFVGIDGDDGDEDGERTDGAEWRTAVARTSPAKEARLDNGGTGAFEVAACGEVDDGATVRVRIHWPSPCAAKAEAHESQRSTGSCGTWRSRVSLLLFLWWNVEWAGD